MEIKEIHDQTANVLIELEEKIHEMELQAFRNCMDAKDSDLTAVYRERLHAYASVRYEINKQIHKVVTGEEED